jgi:hypothetical protein
MVLEAQEEVSHLLCLSYLTCTYMYVYYIV